MEDGGGSLSWSVCGRGCSGAKPRRATSADIFRASTLRLACDIPFPARPRASGRRDARRGFPLVQRSSRRGPPRPPGCKPRRLAMKERFFARGQREHQLIRPPLPPLRRGEMPADNGRSATTPFLNCSRRASGLRRPDYLAFRVYSTSGRSLRRRVSRLRETSAWLRGRRSR